MNMFNVNKFTYILTWNEFFWEERADIKTFPKYLTYSLMVIGGI